MSFGETSGVTYIIFLISDGATVFKRSDVRTGITFKLSMCEVKEMILFIQCVVCCLFLTLAILPAQYKDPINMIMSYPPKIRQRVEELPQYKKTIKQREKVHVGKKYLG